MKILIDNGNGLNTLGKRSPDGTLIEAAYTREIGRRIVSDLTDRGYDAELLVPEDEDISLSERVKRVNAISSSCPAQTGHLAPNVSSSASTSTLPATDQNGQTPQDGAYIHVKGKLPQTTLQTASAKQQ